MSASNGYPARPARCVAPALAIVILLVVGYPATGRAQLVNEKDPCYLTLFGTNLNPWMTQGSWESADDVGNAAALIRASVAFRLDLIKERVAKAATGYLTPGELESLRATNRCLPWLRSLLRRLDDALKRLSINSIVIAGERNPVAAQAVMRAITDDLAEAERLLTAMLRRPQRGLHFAGAGGSSPIHAMAAHRPGE
jgi:hypothetical protein